MERKIKIGAREGSGPPPGYVWSVWVLDVAYKEAADTFNDAQYKHLVVQMQDLAGVDEPARGKTADVRPIEDFHELRDRGGVLNALNARVFFGIDKEHRALVVIGAISKQNNGPTPQGDKVRMRRRWRKYRNGDYGTPV